MHVISKRAMAEFCATHPRAAAPLAAWRAIVAKTDFENFAHLRKTFNSVDRVGSYYVFDIAGNNFRLVAATHCDRKRLYIRHLFTLADYDRWKSQ